MPEFAPEHPENLQAEEADTESFLGLMDELSKKYGSLERAAQVLDKDSGIAATVVLKWFKHKILPNPQITKKLLSSLRYLVKTELSRLGLGHKRLVPPMGSKPKPEGLSKTEPGKEPTKE